jgi:hypothetical protein
VRSPPADITQAAPHVVAARHAQVGVSPHAAGYATHEYVPADPTAPPIAAWQYWVPCVQNPVPHGNIPDGVVQPPVSETSCPADLATHALL